MNTEPPVGDDLQRMLVSMKETVLSRAAERPRRSRSRGRIGVVAGVVALLGIGVASGSIALGMIPQPFSAAPSASPTAPATTTPTPSSAPIVGMPTPTPTTTRAAFALDDPTTWTITPAEVGPVAIGGTLDAESDDLAAAYEHLESPYPNCEPSTLWGRDGGTTIELSWGQYQEDDVASVFGVMVAAPGGTTPSGPVPGPTTAAGIGVGSTLSELRAAYPTLGTYYKPTDADAYTIWSVRDDAGVLLFDVGDDGQHIRSVWASTDPSQPIALCGFV